MAVALASPPCCILQTSKLLSIELLSQGATPVAQAEDGNARMHGNARTQLQEVLTLTRVGQSTDDADIREANLVALLEAEAPLRLLRGFQGLDFEMRNDAVSAFEALLRLGRGAGRPKLVEHVRVRAPEISHLITHGSANPEMSSHYGFMLRACLRDAHVTSALLSADCATQFMRLARDDARFGIDVSLEAFASLRSLLLTQKAEVAAYAAEHFDDFFGEYHELLMSKDYATRRQAVRLLGDILLDRQFSGVMLSYACRERFLQIHMNLLRDASRTIQLDAFHVFKLFVANPHKSPRVQAILGRNAARLTQLLGVLSSSKGGAHLKGDVQILTGTIESLGLQLLPRNPRTTSRRSATHRAVEA